jgi:hypothetical protein
VWAPFPFAFQETAVTDTAHTLAADVWRFVDIHADAFATTGRRVAVIASTTSASVSLLGDAANPAASKTPSFDSRHADLAWAAIRFRLEAFGLACAQVATPFFEGPAGFACTMDVEPKPTFQAGWVPPGCVPVVAWAKPMQPQRLDAAIATLAPGPQGARLWSLRLPDSPLAHVDAVVQAPDVQAASELFRALFRVSRTAHFNVREAYSDHVEAQPLATGNGSSILDSLRTALRAAANAAKRWEPEPFATASLTLSSIPSTHKEPWVLARPDGWRVAWDAVPEGDGFDADAGDEARVHLLDFALQMDALPFLRPATSMEAWITLVPGGDVLVGLRLGDATGSGTNPNGQELGARAFLQAWEPILEGLEAMAPAEHAWSVQTSRWSDGLRLGASNRAEALGAAQLLVGPFHRRPTVYRLPTVGEHGLLVAPTSLA